MMEHTPGPWIIRPGPTIIRVGGEDTLSIALVSRQRDEWDANAHLIASAPELLAALQTLLKSPYGCSLCDSGISRNRSKGHQPDCPYEMARAAIAKARGE